MRCGVPSQIESNGFTTSCMPTLSITSSAFARCVGSVTDRFSIATDSSVRPPSRAAARSPRIA